MEDTFFGGALSGKKGWGCAIKNIVLLMIEAK